MALELIKSTGALREGHFILASDNHSGHFVNKNDVSTQPYILDELAKSIADHFWGEDISVVAAPAAGAIALGNRVAAHYGRSVISVFAEQEEDRFLFHRGYARFIQIGTRVLLVEDIITTGKTTSAMIKAVSDLGGQVVGIGLLWNRNLEGLEVPSYACVNKVFANYESENCPLCRAKVPIDTEVNKHGREFLTKYGENPASWPANKGS